MQMKYNKDGDFTNVYPETLAENVKFSSGDSLQEKQEETNRDLWRIDVLENSMPSTKSLYESDGLYMKESQTVTPSKKLSECMTGWILAWKKYDHRQQYNYTHVPKIHAEFAKASKGLKTVLSDRGGTIIQKYLYIDDKKIEGHDSNKEGDNEGLVLAGVFEY